MGAGAGEYCCVFSTSVILVYFLLPCVCNVIFIIFLISKSCNLRLWLETSWSKPRLHQDYRPLLAPGGHRTSHLPKFPRKIPMELAVTIFLHLSLPVRVVLPFPRVCPRHLIPRPNCENPVHLRALQPCPLGSLFEPNGWGLGPRILAELPPALQRTQGLLRLKSLSLELRFSEI